MNILTVLYGTTIFMNIKIFKVALFVAKIESKLGYFEGTILNLHMDNLIIDSISATVL